MARFFKYILITLFLPWIAIGQVKTNLNLGTVDLIEKLLDYETPINEKVDIIGIIEKRYSTNLNLWIDITHPTEYSPSNFQEGVINSLKAINTFEVARGILLHLESYSSGKQKIILNLLEQNTKTYASIILASINSIESIQDSLKPSERFYLSSAIERTLLQTYKHYKSNTDLRISLLDVFSTYFDSLNFDHIFMNTNHRKEYIKILQESLESKNYFILRHTINAIINLNDTFLLLDTIKSKQIRQEVKIKLLDHLEERQIALTDKDLLDAIKSLKKSDSSNKLNILVDAAVKRGLWQINFLKQLKKQRQKRSLKNQCNKLF